MFLPAINSRSPPPVSQSLFTEAVIGEPLLTPAMRAVVGTDALRFTMSLSAAI